jgi:hypothetical protein
MERTRDFARVPVDLGQDHLDLIASPSGEGSLADDLVQAKVLKEDKAKLAKIGLEAIDWLAHAAPPSKVEMKYE